MGYDGLVCFLDNGHLLLFSGCLTFSSLALEMVCCLKTFMNKSPSKAKDLQNFLPIDYTCRSSIVAEPWRFINTMSNEMDIRRSTVTRITAFNTLHLHASR